MRPLIAREASEVQKWKCKENTVCRLDPESGKTVSCFMFDKVYDASATNSDIFTSMVQPLIDKAVEGFNATILAYGQTSSGKTYTMMGTDSSKGIVPLCMDYIFQAIDRLPDERLFLLGVSFLEVYNEKIRDLLAPEKTDLKLHETVEGVVKFDCKNEMVSNPFEMMDFLEQGNQNKAIGETNMNERSSRSHTIFRIECAARVSHINLVDLAGSERASQTGTSGQRYKEGCAINRSLLQLGNVVQKLSEGKGEFIDYRSSKLTRMLQPSLSGNAIIAMICNITSVALEQTQCTLQFANRAMAIKLSPHLNEVMDDATLIKRHAKRIKDAVDRGDTSHTSSLNVSSLSSEEQPSSMSMSLDNRSSLGSNVSTRVSLDPETPPSVLRSRILQLQKKVDNSGTPQSVLRQRISMLQTQLTQLSTCAGTSSELLKERLGILSDSPTKTPVSAMKERFDSYAAVTPPAFLREQIKRLERNLEMLEEEYKTLQEFTTLERQCSVEDVQKELESLKQSLQDYETMYLDSSKLNSELKDENYALRETVEQLQTDLENTKKELDANKLWSCRNSEQQMHWKKELEEYKEKLTALTNESKDWQDEKYLMRGSYEEKIAELQQSLSEAWAQQATLQAILDDRNVVVTSDIASQTSKDEEECDNSNVAVTSNNASQTDVEEEECDILREQMFFMDQEIANLNMELLTKQESLQYTSSEIEKLKSELAQSNKSHTAQMQQREQELQELRDRMEELSMQKITVAVADITIKESDTQDHLSDETNNLDYETVTQKLEELTRNYEESQNEIQTNKLSMNDMQNKIEELCEERKLLLSKVDEFEGKARGVFEYQHDSWTCLGAEMTAVELPSTPAHNNSSMLQSTVRYAPSAGSLKQLEQDHNTLTQRNTELSEELTRTLDMIKQQGLLLNLPAHLTGTSPQIGDFLTQHITQLLDTKTALESALAALRVDVAQLQQDNAALTSQLSEATNAMKVQARTCDTLRQQLSEAPSSLNESVSDDVTCGVKRLIAEMRAMNSSFSVEALNQMTLPELIEKFIACIFEKQMDCFNKLQGDIQTMEEKNLKLKTDLRDKLDMIRDLETSKSELLQQLSEIKAQLKPSEPEEYESCHMLQSETLQESGHKSEQLEVALGEMKQSYEAMVEEKRSAAERVCELEESVRLARETASVLEKQVLELRERDGQVRSAPDGISAEETALDRDTELLLKTAKQRITDLEAEVFVASTMSKDKMHELWRELETQTSEKEHLATQLSRLESAYKEQQEQMAALSAQFSTVTSQLEAQMAKNQDLTQSMVELQQAQSDLESEMVTCRAELEQQIQDMTSERDEVLCEKLQLEQQLSAAKVAQSDVSMTESPAKGKNVESLSLELQQQINLSSSQAFKITKLEAERTKLEEQITTLTEESALKEQLQVQLEAERTKLEEQLSTLTQKLTEESGNDVTLQEQLVMKLQDAEERESVLQEKISELQVQLQELEEQAAAKNAELNEGISTLLERNCQMVADHTQQNLALQQQLVEFQQIKEQLTEVTERERNLKNTLETSKVTVASLEKELEEQRATAAQLSASKLALEEERQQLNDKISNISEELEARGEMMKAEQSEQLCLVRESESRLKHALKEAESKLGSLSSELDQQVSANKQLRYDISEMTEVKRNLDQQVNTNQQLQEEKTLLDSELTEAKKNLSMLLSEYEKVAKELEGTQARCERLERDLAQHEQLVSELDEARQNQQKWQCALQDSEEKLVNLKSELDLQVEANEQLASAKNSLEREQQELQLQMKQMAMEFERVSAQAESHKALTSKYQGLEEELASFQTLHSQLKIDLESEHQLRAEAQVHLAEVQSQLQVLNTHYSELEAKHSTIQRENEDLQSTVSQLQASLLEAERFNETFKSQIASQEKNIQSLQKEIIQIQAANVELQTLQRNQQQQLHAARAAQQEAELACEKLRSDLTAAHAAQQETELVYEKYKTDLVAMSREFEEQGVMVESLQNDLAKSNMLLNAAQEDKELLRKRLDKAVQEIEEQKVAAYEKEALRLKNNPEISQQSLAFYQQELQAKSARLAELERMADDSKHLKTKLESDMMELRRNLADKRGEVALMEKKMLMDDLPHQKEAERARREVEYLEQKVRSLQSELRHVRNSQQEATFHQDCPNCRRRVQRAGQTTQTSPEEFTCSVAVQAPPDNETLWDRRDGYLPSSAITEAGRMYGMKQQLDDALARTQKLESERSMFKDELRKRHKYIAELQRVLANKENKGQVPMANQKT
ncbi:hypothetical protein B566_EDAN012464 [Ephemera danica]|nr:hypothetical protein B566_EDAN012464 [Ephemera danica]